MFFLTISASPLLANSQNCPAYEGSIRNAHIILPNTGADRVAVFLPSGECAGISAVDEGTWTAITAWGSDDLAPTPIGFDEGDPFSYFIGNGGGQWEPAVPFYERGPSTYTEDGVSVLYGIVAAADTTTLVLLDSLLSDIQSLDSLVVAAQTQIDALTATNAQLTSDLSLAVARGDSLQGLVDNFPADLAAVQASLDLANARVATLESDISTAEDQVRSILAVIRAILGRSG